MPEARRPLLVIDGDYFAHRSYHALPKSIRRTGNHGGGAIVGFANFLLRLYESERPRAVLVGWDTLGAPTYRQTLFPAYQGGREFDDELVEQLEVLPEFVAACGFASAKEPGYEADDFLAAAAAAETRRKGRTLVATGDRDAFQLASATVTILQPVRAGEMARIGPAEVRERYGVEPGRCLISSRCAAIRRTRSRGQAASVRKARPLCSGNTRRWRTRSPTVASRPKPTTSGSTAASPRWTPQRPCPRSMTRHRPGARRPAWRENGN